MCFLPILEGSTGRYANGNFKLWGKIELNESEQMIVKWYRFDEAICANIGFSRLDLKEGVQNSVSRG